MPNTQTANYGPSSIHGGAAGAGSNFLIGDTTLLLPSGDGALFPATTPYYLTISDGSGALEIVSVTAIGGDTLTVTRGQFNTPAVSWGPGSKVEYDKVAGNVAYLWSSVSDVLTARPVTQSTTAPTLASSGTIATAGIGVSRVTTGAAVTGVILQAGTVAGQIVTVINESANSITFAAAGTSHVADGVSDVIAASTAASFVWDSGTSLWYHVK